MQKALYRKHNDRIQGSSTYHKKDGTNVRAILKEEANRETKNALTDRSQTNGVGARQGNLFAEPDEVRAAEVSIKKKLAVPTNTIKLYNPKAKKFLWDGKRFGVKCQDGQIVWLKYHFFEKRQAHHWVKDLREGQPESYTSHFMKDAGEFSG